MSSQEAKTADSLYGLLVAYVQVCDIMEEHNRKVMKKHYRTLDLEREAYNHVQTKYQQPVMAKCAWYGFKYSDLMETIPPAFETTSSQRHAILKDLRMFYKKEFGEYVLPV